MICLTRHLAKRLVSLCLVGMFIGACATKTPLERAVERDAQDFRVKRLVVSDHELGRLVENERTTTDDCFHVEPQEDSARSWTEQTLTYSRETIGQLSADLDSVLTILTDSASTIAATASASDSIHVVLRDAKLAEISGTPNAKRCPRFMGRAANLERSYSIVTRALGAGSIDLEQQVESGFGVGFNTRYLRGEFSRSSSGIDTWEGEELYFAEFLESFQVTRANRLDTLATSETVIERSCRFKLVSIDRDDWIGQISCGGDSDPIDVGGDTGSQIVTKYLEGGFTVSVAVTYLDRVGLGEVDFQLLEVEPYGGR